MQLAQMYRALVRRDQLVREYFAMTPRYAPTQRIPVQIRQEAPIRIPAERLEDTVKASKIDPERIKWID